MPCEIVRTPGGVTSIVCGPAARRSWRKCHYCGRPAPYLCDFLGPITKKVCDRPICEDHREKIFEDVDWCKLHREAKK